jgi:hypothetical protein
VTFAASSDRESQRGKLRERDRELDTYRFAVCELRVTAVNVQHKVHALPCASTVCMLFTLLSSCGLHSICVCLLWTNFPDTREG